MNITGICTVLIAFAFPKEVLSQQPLKAIHREMTAELRITQTGMALLRHKQSRDAFPETLKALKLQNINDPFSKELLRYESQGQDFILYSIGPDK